MNALRSFGALLGAHLWRRKWIWLSGITALLAFAHFFTIGINVTESLPHHVFLVKKWDKTIERNAIMAFRWRGGGPYSKDMVFLKIAYGLPGDRVTMGADRQFFVNGIPAGIAKKFSRQGIPLQSGPVGIIPKEHYYMHTPHPDSLDSRYAMTGWIAEQQIIGRAIPVF